MPCDAHRSWKKGDCPSCGSCKCCPAPAECDPSIGKHTAKASKKNRSGGGAAELIKKKKKKKRPQQQRPQQQQQQQQQQHDQIPPVSSPFASSSTDATSSVPSDQQLYQVDERVFATDKTGIYEAVIKNVKLKQIKVKSSPSSSSKAATIKHEWSYLVHYLGWNTRWDRWTDGKDLKRDTPAIRAEAEKVQEEAARKERERKTRQRERREQKQHRKRRKTSGDDADDGGMSSRGPSSPRFGGAKAPSKEYVQSTLEECCTLPFTLKTILVDDKTKLTRLGYYVASGYDDVALIPNWTPPRKVHVLPSQVPTKLVLKQYWKEKKRAIKEKTKSAVIKMAKTKEAEEGSDCSDLEASDIASIKERSAAEEESWKTFIKGILDLFDDALPPFLLYKQERTHYLAAKMDPSLLGENEKEGSSSRKPSDVYGAEHLLRLFVRLPQIASASTITLFLDRSSLTGFADGVSDLIVFLQKNKASCFKGRYRDTKEIEWTVEEAEVVKRCSARAAAAAASGENDVIAS